MTHTRLAKRGSTYYFRRVIPQYLRPYFMATTGNPRREFMLSLGTKDRKEAIRLVERKAVEVSEEFAKAEALHKAG